MPKTLLVPDHILQKRKKEKAYVKKEERVLDPTLLDKSFKERLPQPTGWRILVAPYQGKEVTDKFPLEFNNYYAFLFEIH